MVLYVSFGHASFGQLSPQQHCFVSRLVKFFVDVLFLRSGMQRMLPRVPGNCAAEPHAAFAEISESPFILQLSRTCHACKKVLHTEHVYAKDRGSFGSQDLEGESWSFQGVQLLFLCVSVCRKVLRTSVLWQTSRWSSIDNPC